jgi:hypothetical protein
MATPLPDSFTPALDGPRGARFQRDSLASRQRTGLPGSRRHRRYLNLAFLTANSTEDGTAEMEVEGRPSPLHQILSENRALWEPFRNTTEEQERRLLRRLAGPVRSQPRAYHGGAAGEGMAEACSAFIRLSSPTRHLLREALLNCNRDLICSLEAALFHRFMPAHQANLNQHPSGREGFNLLSASCLPAPARPRLGDEHLIILMHNSRDRRICHGVCKYYSLLSWSETTSRGQRVTVVVKPKGGRGGCQVPGGVELSHYLARVSGRADVGEGPW